MTHTTKILTTLLFLVTLTTQAFAANLNTTYQWRAWQTDFATIQRYQGDANRYMAQRSSYGYQQAANCYDRIAGIHSRNADRFANLASSTNDSAIAQQASYQSRSRSIHAQQFYNQAQNLRNLAAQQARLGR